MNKTMPPQFTVGSPGPASSGSQARGVVSPRTGTPILHPQHPAAAAHLLLQLLHKVLNSDWLNHGGIQSQMSSTYLWCFTHSELGSSFCVLEILNITATQKHHSFLPPCFSAHTWVRLWNSSLVWCSEPHSWGHLSQAHQEQAPLHWIL